MKKLLVLGLTGWLCAPVFAQPAKEQQAIKSLCGCFEVDFKYAETFAADTAYKFHKRYHASGLEWVVAEETGDKKLVLQHLLVISDSDVIKHWREDWEYEKADWWQFKQDATWQHVAGNAKNARGQWTQTVWEVDDAPRYQGSGNWVESNGKYYWENTTDAPLPRREYSKRNDYNVMQRTNRIIVTDSGWLHEQDNKKLLRQPSADVYLAEEKGYNYYKKTDDSKCKIAAAWWTAHKSFWKTIRQSWASFMKDKNVLMLTRKVDGKLLYERLDMLEEKKLPAKDLEKEFQSLLVQYSAGSENSSASAQ